jgi:hypothetical protein
MTTTEMNESARQINEDVQRDNGMLARASGTVPALVLLSPQPDEQPFQIGGDKSGNWYNERRRHKRTGQGPWLIEWRPPQPGMRPVSNFTTGHQWAWQNTTGETTLPARKDA